jgi:hypothetical protein
VIDEILKYRRMKIRLQNTIGAVQMTKGADMQYLIITTGITACAGTFLYECPFVAGKAKRLFSF